MLLYTESQSRVDLFLKVQELWQTGPHAQVPLIEANMLRPPIDTLSAIVEFDYILNYQDNIEINPDPTTVRRGYISLVIGVRQGTGTAKLALMRDYLNDGLKGLWVGKTRTEVPEPLSPWDVNGWRFVGLRVPTYFYSRYKSP